MGLTITETKGQQGMVIAAIKHQIFPITTRYLICVGFIPYTHKAAAVKTQKKKKKKKGKKREKKSCFK
jgi:hypothetical protein